MTIELRKELGTPTIFGYEVTPWPLGEDMLAILEGEHRTDGAVRRSYIYERHTTSENNILRRLNTESI